MGIPWPNWGCNIDKRRRSSKARPGRDNAILVMVVGDPQSKGIARLEPTSSLPARLSKIPLHPPEPRATHRGSMRYRWQEAGKMRLVSV